MLDEGVVEDFDLIDGMTTSHLPWTLEHSDATSCVPSTLRRATVGDFKIVACTTGAARYRRRRREIAMTDGSYVGLLMVTEGHELLEQDGRQVTVGAGSLVAWDGERTAMCAVLGHVTKISLFVPRERFASLVRRPELMIMQTLSASQATHLLRSLLDELLDSAPLDTTIVPGARGAAQELLRAVWRQALPRARSWDNAVALQTALNFIDEHLGDPCLDPARVARATGVSVRQLYDLFAVTDVPIWAHIRQRRLARAHEELSRLPVERSIAHVARSCGFTSAAHFTRAFRSQFDETPSAVRQRTAQDAGLEDAS